jgi:hypothetical protein
MLPYNLFLDDTDSSRRAKQLPYYFSRAGHVSTGV